MDTKVFYDRINLFCARISSRLAYGPDVSAPDHVLNVGKFVPQLDPPGPVTYLAPLLRNSPEWLVPEKRGVQLQLRQETEERLWKGLSDQMKEKYKQGSGIQVVIRIQKLTTQIDG